MGVGKRGMEYTPRGRLQVRGDEYTRDFADSHLTLNDWKRKMSENPLICSVSEPRKTNKGFFRKQVLYVVRVSSKAGSHRVERSFKDFVALREAMMRRFEGCVCPPLPSSEKNKVKNEAMIVRRMHALEHFLQTMADHPYMRNESCFTDFITLTKPLDHKALQNPSPVQSEGLARWQEALKITPFLKDPVANIKLYSQELQHCKEKLTMVLAACKNQMKMLQDLATSSVDLTVGFQQWALLEGTKVKSLDGEAFSPTSKAPNGLITVKEQINDLAMMNSQYAAVLHEEYGSVQLDDVLVDAVRFELACVKEWDDALSTARNKLRGHQRIQDNLSDIEEKLGDLSNSGGGGQEMKYLQSKLDDCRAALRNSEQETGQYQRAILGIEILLFKEARAIRAEKINRAYVTFHLQGIEALRKCFDGTGVGYTLEDSNRVKAKGFMGRRFNRHRKSVGDADSSTINGSRFQSVGGDSDVASLADFDVFQIKADADDDHATLKVTRRYRAKKNDELDINVDQVLTAVRISDDLWYATAEDGATGVVHANNVMVASSTGNEAPSNPILSFRPGGSSQRLTAPPVKPQPPNMSGNSGMNLPPGMGRPPGSHEDSGPPGSMDRRPSGLGFGMNRRPSGLGFSHSDSPAPPGIGGSRSGAPSISSIPDAPPDVPESPRQGPPPGAFRLPMGGENFSLNEKPPAPAPPSGFGGGLPPPNTFSPNDSSSSTERRSFTPGGPGAGRSNGAPANRPDAPSGFSAPPPSFGSNSSPDSAPKFGAPGGRKSGGSRKSQGSSSKSAGSSRFGNMFNRRPSKGAPPPPSSNTKPSRSGGSSNKAPPIPKDVPKTAIKPNALLGAIQGFDKGALKKSEDDDTPAPSFGGGGGGGGGFRPPMNPMDELKNKLNARRG